VAAGLRSGWDGLLWSVTKNDEILKQSIKLRLGRGSHGCAKGKEEARENQGYIASTISRPW
jgi:hypothetical protein